MLSHLTKIQRAAEISKTIWIDDAFSGEPQVDRVKAFIRASLASLFALRKTSKHGNLRHIDPSSPEGIRNAQLEIVLEDESVNLSGCVDSLVRQLQEEDPSYDAHDDLNPAQFNMIGTSLSDVVTLSFAQWHSRAADMLKEVSQETLILVDREDDRDGYGAEAGDDILKAIVTNTPQALCIMLTHTVSMSEVGDLRRTLSDKTGLPFHKVFVLSKRDIGPLTDDADVKFARALKAAMLQRFCVDVTTEAISGMAEDASRYADDLSLLSIDEIDESIFGSSMNEGASEIGVVTRILMLRQRMAMQAHMARKTEQYVELLKRIRKVREQLLPADPAITHLRPSVVHEWRRAEIIDPGDWINPISSPLACGDVFLQAQTGRKYALLAQPCDLVVRARTEGDCKDGERNRDEGLFAELVLDDKGKANTNRFYVLERAEGGRHWILDFKTVFAIDMRLLDLAVLNSSGSVEWLRSQERPKTLLPGWGLRYDRCKTDFTTTPIPACYQCPCLANRLDVALTHNEEEGSFRWPLKRVGRIRPPYSHAILGSYAAYLSRAAYEHDFAKGLCGMVDEPNIKKGS